jgi:hypothetical protein
LSETGGAQQFGVGWAVFQVDGVGGGFEDVAGGGVEVLQGTLQVVADEAGAAEVHAVGGEAGDDFEVGALDVVAGVEAVDEEGLIGDDGGDVVVVVGVAHVVVVHGDGAATDAGLVGKVEALMRLGWFALEVLVRVVHVVPPPGVSPDDVVETVVVMKWE